MARSFRKTGVVATLVAVVCLVVAVAYRSRVSKTAPGLAATVPRARPLPGGVRTPEYAPLSGPRLTGANVLLVTIDTLRRDHLAPYGAPFETVAASRLAREGVLFEDAVSQVPLTLPSHASLFTGLYPRRHAVRDNGGFVLSADTTTLAERLLGHGYRTAGFVGSYVLHSRWGIAQGYETYDDSFDYSGIESRNLTDVERPAGSVVDHALEWLRARRRGERPFYLWVHLYDPHEPYAPPDEYRRRAKTAYAGEVMYADAQVARLLDALDELGLRRSTLVALPGRPRRVARGARRVDARPLPVRRDAGRAAHRRATARCRARLAPAGPGGAARARAGASRRRRADHPRPRRASRSARPRRREPVADAGSRTRPGRGLPSRRLAGGCEWQQRRSVGRARRPGVLRRDLVPSLPLRLERARRGGDGALEARPGAAARALRPALGPEGAPRRGGPAPPCRRDAGRVPRGRRSH